MISAFLARSIVQPALHILTDVNQSALLCSRETLACNGSKERSSALVRCSLLSAIRRSLKVDILIFNPPYYPTESEEAYGKNDISAAWAGGKCGIEITLPLLKALHSILAPNGVFFLVAIAQNKPNDLINFVCAEFERSNSSHGSQRTLTGHVRENHPEALDVLV